MPDLLKKSSVKCWNEQWESQLCSAWESREDHDCSTPTSVWFLPPTELPPFLWNEQLHLQLWVPLLSSALFFKKLCFTSS